MSKKSILLEKPSIWKPTVLVLFVVVSLIGYSAITGRNTHIDKLQEEKDYWKSLAEVWQDTFFDQIKPISVVLLPAYFESGWQISNIVRAITTLPVTNSSLSLVVGESVLATYNHYNDNGVCDATTEITISKIKEKHLENYYFYVLDTLLNPPKRYDLVEVIPLGENKVGAWAKVSDNHWVGWVKSYDFIGTIEIKTQDYTLNTEEIAGYLYKIWLNIERVRGGWITIPHNT